MPPEVSPAHPLRIAIVGAGPTGFFLAERLLGQSDLPVTVDLFERLPTPFGLVRYGVAPDHEKIKNVTRAFSKTAGRPGFRFLGHVDVGTDLTLEDLRRHYHQICFTTGAQTDRPLGIPGEALAGSHAATEFVAWYNGHPGYREARFDLSVERAAVIGVGNVAVDVARILCRTHEELATTDIADHALDALRGSAIREVLLIGRRGPAQAAFTNPEVKELGEMAGADVRTRPEEIALDALSATALEADDDATTRKKLEILADFAAREPTGKPRMLTLRFLTSPTELVGDPSGRVAAIRLVRNRLVEGRGGRLSAEPTGDMEEIPVGLVFRSVGYRGVPLSGLPFDDRNGTVPNAQGRVIEAGAGEPLRGLYVSGWIRRGPSGVIGTNKPDAAEVAEAMLEDAAASRTLNPAAPATGAIDSLLADRGVEVVDWPGWERLDAVEQAAGRSAGRSRVKRCTVGAMLDAARARGL